MKHTLYTNKSKTRLTKSPKLLVISVFVSVTLLISLITSYVWMSVDHTFFKLGTACIGLITLLLVTVRLSKVSEAFFMSDMIIVEPLFGKKIITPIQGVVVKKSIVFGFFDICKVYVRLDGKKSIHFFYGKCEDLLSEKVKIEDFLLELKQNKKVNHKPGSVSSVA